MTQRLVRAEGGWALHLSDELVERLGVDEGTPLEIEIVGQALVVRRGSSEPRRGERAPQISALPATLREGTRGRLDEPPASPPSRLLPMAAAILERYEGTFRRWAR